MSSAVSLRYALVTGANRGLGLALCRRLHDLGYEVLAAVRDSKGAASLGEFERHRVLAADFRSLASVEGLAASAADACNGRLHALINNAGVGFHCRADRLVTAELEETFYVNALAPILLTSRLLPALQTVQGHIVNITTKLVDAEMAFTSTYTASKRALAGYAAVVRSETGVRVSSIEPGAMASDFLRNTTDGPVAKSFDDRRLKRLDIDTVADLVARVIDTPPGALVERMQVVPTDQVL